MSYVEDKGFDYDPPDDIEEETKEQRRTRLIEQYAGQILAAWKIAAVSDAVVYAVMLDDAVIAETEKEPSK